MGKFCLLHRVKRCIFFVAIAKKNYRHRVKRCILGVFPTGVRNFIPFPKKKTYAPSETMRFHTYSVSFTWGQ